MLFLSCLECKLNRSGFFVNHEENSRKLEIYKALIICNFIGSSLSSLLFIKKKMIKRFSPCSMDGKIPFDNSSPIGEKEKNLGFPKYERI